MTADRKDYFNKARVETFSDGVFAIIVTLLVLSIEVPDITDKKSMPQLAHALAAILPKIFSWMVSFLIVCVIWVNHHRIFQQLTIITHSLFWLNANLLLWCSFIPFPTALMGNYVNNPVSLITFGVILAFMAASFSIMRYNILKNRFVLDEGVDITHYKASTKKSVIFGPVLYLAGALSSLIHPYISFAVYCFIPLYFIFYNSAKIKNQQL